MDSDFFGQARQELGTRATWPEVYARGRELQRQAKSTVYEEELDVLHIHGRVAPAATAQELQMRLENVEAVCKKLIQDKILQGRVNDVLLERVGELERTTVKFSTHRVDL